MPKQASPATVAIRELLEEYPDITFSQIPAGRLPRKVEAHTFNVQKAIWKKKFQGKPMGRAAYPVTKGKRTVLSPPPKRGAAPPKRLSTHVQSEVDLSEAIAFVQENGGAAPGGLSKLHAELTQKIAMVEAVQQFSQTFAQAS